MLLCSPPKMHYFTEHSEQSSELSATVIILLYQKNRGLEELSNSTDTTQPVSGGC